MQRKDFPSCCTAKIYIGMGPSGTADHYAGIASNGFSPRGFARELIGVIRREYNEGHGTAVFSVNNEQVVADTILRRMGSHYNPWASSDNHSTKVRVHVINVKAAAEILINHGVLRRHLGGLQDYPGTVEHSEYLDKLCKGL